MPPLNDYFFAGIYFMNKNIGITYIIDKAGFLTIFKIDGFVKSPFSL
jgi:hypothetical protein